MERDLDKAISDKVYEMTQDSWEPVEIYLKINN